jgi:hypothetical protein
VEAVRARLDAVATQLQQREGRRSSLRSQSRNSIVKSHRDRGHTPTQGDGGAGGGTATVTPGPGATGHRAVTPGQEGGHAGVPAPGGVRGTPVRWGVQGSATGSGAVGGGGGPGLRSTTPALAP